jgi:hypothetical protein
MSTDSTAAPDALACSLGGERRHGKVSKAPHTKFLTLPMTFLNQRDCEALEHLAEAFHACPRPDHFTNFGHCEECAEHDETLRELTPGTLTIEIVGNPGWDPICFISPEGFAYFLPGLARLAFGDSFIGSYAAQLFWHLISNGPNNERFMHCSEKQRCAVAKFVAYLIEARATEIEAEGAVDDAMRAFEIWSGNSGA